MAAVVVQVKKSVVVTPAPELPTTTPETPVEGSELDSELDSNPDSDLESDTETETTGAGPTGIARPFVDVDPVKSFKMLNIFLTFGRF